ncbi:MAG: recombination mediator RecR [candidate division WOR-3 bacterium]|nr:recombination mediator RecR [candidate division WOR-3 bacterium]
MSLIEDLIEKLQWLPGIGKKTAQRLAFFLQKMDVGRIKELTDAILKARLELKECSICHNLGETDPCEICSSPNRNRDMICVVEQPADVMVIEKIGEYKGLYHILHGVISPIDNIGPEDLKIESLIARVKEQNVSEVIVATNPTTEGDVTALYIARLLKPLNIKVTRIARGLPTGSDLGLADTTTILRAFEGRNEL